MLLDQPYQVWNYYYNIHPLQAAKCCRTSRIVVYVNDLKYVTNEKRFVIIEKFDEFLFVLKL